MNIQKLSESIVTRKMTRPVTTPQVREQKNMVTSSEHDRIDTSDIGHLVAGNLSALTAANAVRADKIKLFQNRLNSGFEIPNSAIRTIFSRMAS